MLRRVVYLVPTVLLALLVSGCGPSQGDLEKSIRDEMKSKNHVVITSFDLKKQGDGTYVGTATADNGDVYDVTTSPLKDNKIPWKALPGQATVERLVRNGLEQQLSTKVKSLQLKKNGPGNYSGPADLETGARWNVTTHMDGTQLLWDAKPANP